MLYRAFNSNTNYKFIMYQNYCIMYNIVLLFNNYSLIFLSNNEIIDFHYTYSTCEIHSFRYDLTLKALIKKSYKIIRFL